MKFQSTKMYGAEQGLSCAFRQWRADSHCRFIHGYALAFRFVFEAEELDERGWVVDFGGLKDLKEELKDVFDHTMAVADNDPMMPEFMGLQRKGLIHLVTFRNGVGCERFAEHAWWMAWRHVLEMNRKEGSKRLWVVSAECMEHSGNSAIYFGTQ